MIACDFFDKVPEGSDALLLSDILHDWMDKACLRILGNCRKAMKPDSRLLILEIVIPPDNEPSVGKLLDLEMMVVTGGQERTESEYKALLESSGFTLSRILPTAETVSLIEAYLP